MYSFFTSSSPSLGSGTGRSVRYWRTSTPPVFSMRMPRIVLGMLEDAIVRVVGSRYEFLVQLRFVRWISGIKELADNRNEDG